MRYAEHAPPDALAPILHCLWSFEDDGAGGEPQRIVPDGRCELVVHYGAPFREVGALLPQPRVVFAGQLTRPLWLEATGPSHVVGARFHPAAARAFLGSRMDAATDTRIDLTELWPGEGGVEAVAALVGRRVAGVAIDATMARCVARLQESGGAWDVDAMAKAAGLGRRQLERRFRDAVGVSPAMLANIFRFRRVFDAIEDNSSRPWTDAAADAGYFDQSHLVRDFRRFVGCTPTEFAASRPGLATALVA